MCVNETKCVDYAFGLPALRNLISRKNDFPCGTNGPHMSSPSIGGKLLANVQEVRLSDVATWMSRRNDSNFPKRARLHGCRR